MYNGVAVRTVPLLGRKDIFSHEEQLIKSIRNFVDSGDGVVLVGGGTGASTVVAARQVGPDGSVHAYEASDGSIPTCRETLRLNGVSDIAECHHAVVEAPVQVMGEFGGADRLTATDLPECDVLVMDCEGAEIDVLDGLEKYPGRIIVETHGHLGSSSEDVRSRLEGQFEEVATRERSETIDVLTFEALSSNRHSQQ